MEKPRVVKLVIAMGIVKLTLIMLPILTMLLMAFFSVNNEFRNGMELWIETMQQDPYTTGVIVGGITIQVVAPFVLLIAIFCRDYKATIALAIWHVLISVSSPFSFVWSVIMLLIVLISKKCKQYLKRVETPEMCGN